MATDATANPQPSWLDTVGGWVSSAGKIFSAGADVYVAANQRLAAIKASNEDTVPAKTQAAPQVVTGAPAVAMPSWVMPVAVGVGVLLLIMVVRKMR